MLAIASILAITALFSMSMLLVLGSLRRSGVAGLQYWFAANACVTCGVILLELRGLIPDFLSIVVGNTTLVVAGILFYAGCARFMGRPAYWWRLLSGVVIVAVSMIFWRYIDDNIRMRFITWSSVITLIYFFLGVLLLRHRPATGRCGYYLFGAMMSWVFAIIQLVRCATFWTLTPANLVTMLTHPWNIALLAVSAIAMPSLTMFVVMLVHDAMLAKLEDAINHDHLTAVLSRKCFERFANDHLSLVTSNQPVSLLLIDLDHFKQINDTWGHAAGDEVLRSFAALAREQIRPGDVLGRLGGEEFGLLLPATALPEAITVAERLREKAEQHQVRGAFGTCRYSISIGVACTSLSDTLDRFAAQADRALYDAKNTGRNRVLVSQMAMVGT
ncbi:diguanylate cyclase (GGDEF)-like protein [Herbaspirillum sp. Sphag1AN]|uniref:GGDEF domain-containing protein n=1 Tax=unclassified Herbaspirillum TaxID=2624150 RepID=UPI00160CAB73|nr:MULTISPECIES: GGDEF domain-containing protein [unclassified Herbaspirillum]MBB3213544.1 diguanylate cyclase (GGDEF)-like protein [Herbaspirillum sp. Sphag1AN]MBB3246742.1 diguanylate cyclase (GGDEF)-like protein [Herbaspirillum sp. Sphag64]